MILKVVIMALYFSKHCKLINADENGTDSVPSTNVTDNASELENSSDPVSTTDVALPGNSDEDKPQENQNHTTPEVEENGNNDSTIDTEKGEKTLDDNLSKEGDKSQTLTEKITNSLECDSTIFKVQAKNVLKESFVEEEYIPIGESGNFTFLTTPQIPDEGWITLSVLEKLDSLAKKTEFIYKERKGAQGWTVSTSDRRILTAPKEQLAGDKGYYYVVANEGCIQLGSITHNPDSTVTNEQILNVIDSKNEYAYLHVSYGRTQPVDPQTIEFQICTKPKNENIKDIVTKC